MYNTCIISMMLPILCWYARRCRQFRVWNISYKFPTSWIKKKKRKEKESFTFRIVSTAKLKQFWNQMNWCFSFAAEQNTYFSQFINVEIDSSHGRAWQWPQTTQTERSTSSCFKSPTFTCCSEEQSRSTPNWWSSTHPQKDLPRALPEASLIPPLLRLVNSASSSQSTNYFILLGCRASI